jgi:hypothetical protein
MVSNLVGTTLTASTVYRILAVAHDMSGVKGEGMINHGRRERGPYRGSWVMWWLAWFILKGEGMINHGRRKRGPYHCAVHCPWHRSSSLGRK